MPLGSRRSLLYASPATSWWLSGGVSSANAIAVYQPKGAASLAASYINLANPGTYDAAPGVAPTLDADGWVFNGSTQYLDSGVIPSVGAWSIIVALSGTDTSQLNQVVSGGQSSSNNRWNIWPVASISYHRYTSGSIDSISATSIISGVMCISGYDFYTDGALESSNSGSQVASAYSNYIGARNSSGSADSFFDGKIQALAIYNTTLSGAQIAAITTAINAL